MGFTRTQLAILTALALGVVLVFCVGGVFVFSTISTPQGKTNNSAQATVAPVAEVLPTITKEPTGTPMRVPSATPTQTRPPSPTKPIPTQTPVIPPTPLFAKQTQKIGPIRDSLRDESFSMQVTLNNVEWSSGSSFTKPKQGNTFVIVTVHVQNLGPGSVHSFGSGSFQTKDSRGAVRDDTYVPGASDCDLDYVDLVSGGTADGCVGFEVPVTGKVEFIYAPYKYEGLKPGRYLSFVIRQ